MGRMHLSEAAEREANRVAMEFAHSNDVMQDMSRAYNVDFSNIRVHTDSAADSKVKAAGRDALAQGRDLFFGKGIFESSDPAAKGLVAHELAHTMQQGAVTGGEMAVSESAPMGAEQGGFLDWIKGLHLFGNGRRTSLFGRRRRQPAAQELTSSLIPESAPAPVQQPPSPTAPTPVSMDNGHMDEADFGYRYQDGPDRTVRFMSTRSRALYSMAKNATAEQFRDPIFRKTILDDYKESMAARMQKFEGETYESMFSKVLRPNSAGEAKTFDMLLKASLPENLTQEMSDMFTSQTAEDGTETNNVDEVLEHALGRIQNDPVMQEILQANMAAFSTSSHFSGEHEDRNSEMTMNRVMLRAIGPAIAMQHKNVKASNALQKAVNSGSTAGAQRFLSLFKRRR